VPTFEGNVKTDGIRTDMLRTRGGEWVGVFRFQRNFVGFVPLLIRRIVVLRGAKETKDRGLKLEALRCVAQSLNSRFSKDWKNWAARKFSCPRIVSPKSAEKLPGAWSAKRPALGFTGPDPDEAEGCVSPRRWLRGSGGLRGRRGRWLHFWLRGGSCSSRGRGRLS
jgi:hypothetical protein